MLSAVINHQARTAEVRNAESASSPAYAAPPRSKAARCKQAQVAAAAAAASASDSASACASTACASDGDPGYVKSKLATIVPWASHRCAHLHLQFAHASSILYCTLFYIRVCM